MKPTLSKFLLLALLITFLSVSTSTPTGAQPPDPPEIMEDGEFQIDLSQIQPAITERSEITVNGGENSLTAIATWWSASGTTFVPAASTATYNYGSAGCVDTGGFDVWRGSVNLQNGSTIIGMWFNYQNEIDDPTDSTIHLMRYKWNGDYDDILHVTGTYTGTGNKSQFTSTVVNNIVDNKIYAYVLVWVGNPDQNLCGVNLSFEPPPIFFTALPIITK